MKTHKTFNSEMFMKSFELKTKIINALVLSTLRTNKDFMLT